jgi:hypothetical protein
MKNSENITESDPYNFLLLSLYYYLKKHNYNQTAQKLFQEGKLDSIFKFPHDLKPPSNDKEKMQNEFIEFFYKNSFDNPNFDFLGDFWGQFWSIFANKMINNNKIETLYNKEQKNILKQTYAQKNIFQNFITNKNIKEENNNEIPKSINILSNISKNTNNNNIGETEEFINIIPNKQEQNPLQENIENKMEKNNNNMGKNNQNYFEEEEEEEGENDIEKEMDEENGFSFTKQKNCQNIIKHSNDMGIQHDELGNEFGDYMNKNIYPGFQINNSLSNLDFNALNGNNMSKEDRNMSGIPLRKDVDMEHNNNNEFNI